MPLVLHVYEALMKFTTFVICLCISLFPAKRELESPQHKLAIIDEAAKKHEEVIDSAAHN